MNGLIIDYIIWNDICYADWISHQYLHGCGGFVISNCQCQSGKKEYVVFGFRLLYFNYLLWQDIGQLHLHIGVRDLDNSSVLVFASILLWLVELIDWFEVISSVAMHVHLYLLG